MTIIEKILFNGISNSVTNEKGLTRIDAAFRHYEEQEMVNINTGNPFIDLTITNDLDDVYIKEVILGLSIVVNKKLDVVCGTLITCIYNDILKRYQYLPQQNLCKAHGVKLSQLTNGTCWQLPLIYTKEGGMWAKLINGTYHFYNKNNYLHNEEIDSEELWFVSPQRVFRKFNNDELVSIDWINENKASSDTITNDLNASKNTELISNAFGNLGDSITNSANIIGKSIIISGDTIASAINRFIFGY